MKKSSRTIVGSIIRTLAIISLVVSIGFSVVSCYYTPLDENGNPIVEEEKKEEKTEEEKPIEGVEEKIE